MAIFRRWHGKKNCTGRILVKLPKLWIQGSQGSHKFNLDEVNLTMKPNVVEKGMFVFPLIDYLVCCLTVPCQCTAKVRHDRPRGRPKKKKRGTKNSPKATLGQAEIELPVLEPNE